MPTTARPAATVRAARTPARDVCWMKQVDRIADCDIHVQDLDGST